MNGTYLDGMGGVNTKSRLDLAAWAFLCIFAFSDLISISVAQISGFCLVICWIGQIASEKRIPPLSALQWPFAVFIVFSLVSASLSLTPVESWKDSKDLLHVFLFFAAYHQFRNHPEGTGIVFRLVVASGGLIAIIGLVQALVVGVDISNRISGLQSIYMTYAGLLMLAITLGAAMVFFDFKKWRDSWIPVALALMTAAVLLSLTRNAWIGMFVGIVAIAAMRKPVMLAALPVIGAIIFAVAPAGVQNRVTSIFDPADVTNRERMLLWDVGLKITADYPLFGVGQNAFPLVYPKYRHPDVKEPNISHLHNNLLEIAVERGLAGLAAWISIWLVALLYLARGWWRRKNGGGGNMVIAASVGSAFAFLFAGMFEYNFGDSEIQMLIYMILAAGLAAVEHGKYSGLPHFKKVAD